MSDDTGWCDLGVYGGGEGRGMPTPNLDHMAVEGVTGSLLCPAELHAGPLGDPDRPDSK